MARFWKVMPFLGCAVSRPQEEGGSRGNTIHHHNESSPTPVRFSYDDLKLATRNFKDENFLGEGGFGTVWKGWISLYGNNIAVAVKCLNPNGGQGHKEWHTEVRCLSKLQHPNLVKLVGYCIEDDKRLLVYEFMSRGSLDDHLFGSNPSLPWATRMKVVLCVAKGLAYLHEKAARPVIIRDLKPQNILLDDDFNAKLSDFGLARNAPTGGANHVTNNVMGTPGYLAPEYIRRGQLSSKIDVYSFGVVLLEVLTGRSAIDMTRPRGQQKLVEWLLPRLIRREVALKCLMDRRLKGKFSVKGARMAMTVALDCLHPDPNMRPWMSQVVRVLESI